MKGCLISSHHTQLAAVTLACLFLQISRHTIGVRLLCLLIPQSPMTNSIIFKSLLKHLQRGPHHVMPPNHSTQFPYLPISTFSHSIHCGTDSQPLASSCEQLKCVRKTPTQTSLQEHLHGMERSTVAGWERKPLSHRLAAARLNCCYQADLPLLGRTKVEV